ncbi:MAG TPA: SRPBCC family protein [Steroidobacteraceae bacterium]|nr:SRPBCC family protein [Steroidobacteraceae bacterium]
MATMTKEVLTDAGPDAVWDAIRDVGALHTRLVPGFVVDTQVVPGARLVTFSNGQTVEEPIVSSSDSLRRLVWTAKAGGLPLTHYNGSVQVHARAAGGSRVEWTADFLPDSAAAMLEPLMNAGAAAMNHALAALVVKSAPGT